MNIIGRNCRCLTVRCFQNGLEGHKTHFVWVQKLRKAFLVGGGWKCFHGSYLWNSLKKEVARSQRRQSCNRSYVSGLRWAIRACWCHRCGLGGTQGSTVEVGGRGGVGGALTSVYSVSVRDSMEMQWCASDKDRRRNHHITPTSPASHLIFPSACFPCLGSSARAANSSAEQGWVGGRRETGRGQEKKCEMKAQQFTSHAAAEDSTANQPDLNDYMTGNKDIFQLRQ